LKVIMFKVIKFKADGHFERPKGGEITQEAKPKYEQSSVPSI
jgi:hypothetical protein